MANTTTKRATKGSTKAQVAPATTAQVAPAPVPVLGKYAGQYAKAPALAHHGVPNSAANTAMLAAYYYTGDHKPANAHSVMGIVAAIVAAAPGITGAALVAAMQSPTWARLLARTKAVRYASNGQLCGAWCAGYIRGAASKAHGHIMATQPALLPPTPATPVPPAAVYGA